MNFSSSLEIALLTIISLILIALGVEALDIYERRHDKSYALRTVGFLLLVSGTKIIVSFAELIFVPPNVRKHIRTLNRDAF